VESIRKIPVFACNLKDHTESSESRKSRSSHRQRLEWLERDCAQVLAMVIGLKGGKLTEAETEGKSCHAGCLLKLRKCIFPAIFCDYSSVANEKPLGISISCLGSNITK